MEEDRQPKMKMKMQEIFQLLEILNEEGLLVEVSMVEVPPMMSWIGLSLWNSLDI